MDQMEQLKNENLVLKERLYACHRLGIKEVDAALAPHLDLLDVDHYEERARLRGLTTQQGQDLDECRTALRAKDQALTETSAAYCQMKALALHLWAQLGHDTEKEPLPGVEP